jgi:uncharacterized RDD family membrane protein YckC
MVANNVTINGVRMAEILLSSWVDRFWAWLIDVLIMGLLWHQNLIALGIDGFSLNGILLLSTQLFLYWTLLEGYRGQSVGKMILKIIVTGSSGEPIGFRDAAVESFGKAFLLPFDILVSLILLRDTRQRLFNRISNTVVVKETEEA